MKKTKKNSSLDKKKRMAYLKDLPQYDCAFVIPLAKTIREHADVVAKYIACVVAKVAVHPFSGNSTSVSRFDILKSLARILFPKTESTWSQIEKSIESIQEHFGDLSLDLLKNTGVTSDLITPLIVSVCNLLEKKPQMIVFFQQPAILEDLLGPAGEQIANILHIIPAMSNMATERFPELKETLFQCLFLLTKEERTQLCELTENIMKVVYKEKVFPMLKKAFSTDDRGRVLAPILEGAIDAIPGESCLNVLLSLACTPVEECSNGRVIAIAIQEMGGLYIKIAQVIAELCPPSLARELRVTQDDAGGIFPSIEKSWEYFLNVLNEPQHAPFLPFLILPQQPQRHYASASVGALYHLELNDEGKAQFNVHNMLVKVQRPLLKELFSSQCHHILALAQKAEEAVLQDCTLSDCQQRELLGLVYTLKRSIINYHRQSEEELDFRYEQINAEKVRNALGANHPIKVPRYFFASENIVFMECIYGTKVTKIIQTKYLERKEIADSIAASYVDLVFNKGVVWADPHPGNILYHEEDSQIAMIDLNPCYVWDVKTREEFKHLIYRLVLHDAEGLYRTLYHLVSDVNSLHCNTVIDDLNTFLHSTSKNANLTRFVGEFIKTLNENHIDLKIEVQAALRGLSQIALTTSSISVRNSFGSEIRRQFRFSELVKTVWNVGVFRVLKVVFSMLFEFIRRMPEEDMGPVLDERDITALIKRTKELGKANVCSVTFRRVSPEDHPSLKMSQDSQRLLITSVLYMDILDKVRPARVRYVIEIPLRKWLKDRQEFVKMASIAKSFCIIECLEQLRRNSLDDYWKIVEAWGKQIQNRTFEETKLVADVIIASRDLYFIRFRNIWKYNVSSLSIFSRFAWQCLLLLEVSIEKTKQKYFISLKKNHSLFSFSPMLYRTYYRAKILVLEGLLWFVKQSVSNLRFSMHLLPMSSSQLEDLVLFGLSRHFNESLRIHK